MAGRPRSLEPRVVQSAPRALRLGRALALGLWLAASAGCEAIVDFDREKIDNAISPPAPLPRYDATVRPLDGGDLDASGESDADAQGPDAALVDGAQPDAALPDAGPDAALDGGGRPDAALDAETPDAQLDASELDADASDAEAGPGNDMDATGDADMDATTDASDLDAADATSLDGAEPDASDRDAQGDPDAAPVDAEPDSAG